ncbi:CHASE domain-containing protein [Aquipseudomonas alcaligenes]|uniref:PAS domain-containing hybrid sensor histidine kinase/response regulator n=1 Tax=Aquipseudomonas alcaligenes TaxID=43263 RepID=UPI001659311B|nr:CHASE domain-containing protein [Pseudomonas alcaligenes]
MNRRKPFISANWQALAALLLGLGASLLGAWLLSQHNQREAQAAVVLAAEAAADTVVKRLELYQYGLRGARGAILTAGEERITREDFHRYSKTRDIEVEFPGARGFGFIRRVPRASEAAFLARARSDGLADFQIRQLSVHAGERYVIQYIEPVEPNAAAVGLDIASEDSRREAAEAAMRSGEVRLSGPITLVQATGSPLQSFLILMPIYRGAQVPASPAEREAAAIGWSYAPLLMTEILSSLHLEGQTAYLQLRDITRAGPAEPFYQSRGLAQTSEPLLRHRVERQVYGRRWQLDFSANPLFVRQLHQPSPQFVLLLGGLVSLLLAALVGVLSVSRRHQRQIVAEQAKLAAIVESSADAIIGQDFAGIVTSWNHGAEQLFGYSHEQALGRALAELVVPPALRAEDAEMLAYSCSGQTVTRADTLRQRQDGQVFAVALSMAPIHDAHGALSGVSTTVRDVSAQKAAEAQVRELNSNLEAQVAQRTAQLRKLNLLLGSVLQSASEVSIIATDRHGVIQVFNHGAERLLGYDSRELLGVATPVLLHVPEELERRAAELSAECGEPLDGFRALVHKPEQEGAETREWNYVRKGGTRFPVSLMVTAIRDEEGALSGYLGIAVDITERQAAERELTAARDQLLMAADVAELGIWSWRLSDDSLQWNERMFELYGLPLSLREGGLSYGHWRMCVHPEDFAGAEVDLARAVEKGMPYESIFRVIRPDGEVRVIQAGAQIEYDSAGKALRVTGINRDITAQRELEQRLLYAKEQADLASAAKSSFLANMSHEIRTPMNAVLGMLQLVQNTELSGRQLDYVSKAETAAKSLLGLLNDILDYSKIEAGKLQLDLHPFALDALMRDLAVVLAGNQGSKEVEVMFDLDSALPVGLLGDSLRLQQVLINLAGNALKFTQQGQVLVRVTQLQRTGDSVRLRFEVADTGIGISAEQLQRIFQVFTQAEASTTRRFGGSGLGLVISRRLVKLMGAELQAASEQGIGSRFWFDLNLGVAQPTSLRADCPGADRPLRLLVVDDNPVGGELLLHTCRALGWQAEYVDSGRRALERVAQAEERGQPYELVLMDWRMPDMDGLSAARQIRVQSGGRVVPLIIMITAYGREALADAQQAGQVPFSGFLVKPVTPRQLAEAVQQACAGGTVASADERRPQADKPRRLDGLRLLVVEDNPLNRQVAYELLHGEGAEVQLAEGGLQGVALATAADATFDAVLMDVQMPDIDGHEATRRILASPQAATLPIIAMTANASWADQQACREAGMLDHVGKPIDLEQLVAALLLHTGRGRSLAAAAPVAAGDGLIETRTAIIERFGGNHELIRNVLANFGPELSRQLASARVQFEQGDPRGVAAVLHAIKGSAGTMGARALSRLAGELEQQLQHGNAANHAAFFADPASLAGLGSIFAASLALLQEAFPPLQPGDPGLAQVPLAPGPWRQALQEILVLLEVGNLQAIELAEALLGRTPASWRPQFEELLRLLQALDFAAAQASGYQLLRSA